MLPNAETSIEQNPIKSHILASYRSMTFITTYQCTAACKECCFECSPQLDSGKLTFEFMSRAIDDAIKYLPGLRLIVFSGGECFMLKENLYKTIAYATEKGLLTRCVTNGYWGMTPQKAAKIAKTLRQSGLTEINISTGLDHQQWVPFKSVVNCATALAAERIRTLITVEKDTAESRCFKEANENAEVLRLQKMQPSYLSLMCNTWMPFSLSGPGRGDPGHDALDKGCKQLFSNVVITPYKIVSACCGLTFEHIPEMRLGKYDTKPLGNFIDDVAEDFLKLWIHLDGPRTVARAILGDKRIPAIEESVHICQACAVLHQNEELRAALSKRYHEFVPEVVSRYLMQRFVIEMEEQSIKKKLQIVPAKSPEPVSISA